MAHLEDIQQTSPVAGQIIAQAGQRDLDRQQQAAQLSQQLQQQRDMTMLRIEAQSGLQRQAADDAMKRAALEHGLAGQLKEQEFDNTIKQMQEQARLQASQFEYQFSAKQRQDIARFNNARQAVASSDQFSPEEKAIALKHIDLQQANIKPSMMPRDPSQPVWPDGQGVGQMWLDQNGSLVGRKPDGGLQLIQRWDQGPEAAKMKLQETQQQKAIELQAKREEALLKIRADLMTRQVEDNKSLKKRFLTPEEIEGVMRGLQGGGRQQEAPWWERAAMNGLQVTDGDRRLPGQVGYAQALVRTLNGRYGGLQNVPPEYREAYLGAVNTLRQFMETEQ